MARKIKTIAERKADLEKPKSQTGAGQGTFAGGGQGFDAGRTASLKNRLAPAVQGGLLRGDGTRNTGDELSKQYGALSKIGETLDGAISGKDKLAKYQKAGLHPQSGTKGASSPTSRITDKFTHLDAKPPSAKGFDDPKDYQIAVSKWEAAQATKQANAIASTTIGIRGEQENKNREDLEQSFRDKATDIAKEGLIKGGGQISNPEYERLTEEQKQLNSGLPEEERIQQYLNFGAEDLTPEQRKAVSDGRNVMFTDEQRKAKADASLRKTYTDPETGKQVVSSFENHLDRVKSFLGAETGDLLETREDGSYYLKDEKGEEVDPIKRAEDKVRKEEEKAREMLNENNRVATDRIKSLHRTPDGGLTAQGKLALQKQQLEYNKQSKELNENVDDALDKTIRAEKKRQTAVETQLAAISSSGEAPKTFAQEISEAKISRLNELKAAGVDDLVALAQVEREYAQMKDDPAKLELSNFISGLDRSGIPMEEQFGAIYAKAGNDSDAAYNAMKGRYGEARAKEMRDNFLETKGWDEQSIKKKEVKDKIQSFWDGEVGDVDEVGVFVQSLQDAQYSDVFIASQIKAMTISPNLNSDIRDEFKAILNEDYEDFAGGGAGDLTFQQQIDIPALGRMLYGARISDKETERVQNIVTAKEARELDRFGLIQRVLGFDVTENKEVGESLMNQVLAVDPEEGLAGFDMLGLAKLLNTGNVAGAIRKVENYSNAIAKKTEGDDFISESFVGANIKKYNKIEEELEDFSATLGLGVIGGTISNWLGRAKESDQKKIGGKMSAAVAKMRNELLGSAVTPAEEAFLEDVLPRPTDTPEQIAVKLDNLKENSLVELNSMRQVYGMPELTEESILNKNLKEDLYKTTQPQEVGTLSERYESGGDSKAFGQDSTGGASYGKYQMTQNSGHAQNFASMLGIEGEVGSPEFKANWDSAVDQDPEGFARKEKAYIKQAHFDPQINRLQKNLGINPESLSPTLQNVIWSTAVQHGGNTDVIENVITRLSQQGEFTEQQLIEAIYEERKTRFPSSTPQVREAVSRRFDSEKIDALNNNIT